MSVARMVELAAALVILGVAVWLYRRPKGPDGYGSQGAVVMFAIAAIMAIHALGGLDYHPSASELEILQGRAR